MRKYGLLSLGVLLTSVCGSAQQAAPQAVEVSRFINTQEVGFKQANGRFGEVPDVLAYAEQHGHRAPFAASTTGVQPRVIVSRDGAHYQLKVTNGDCVAAFSDESGLIYVGSVLGCETHVASK